MQDIRMDADRESLTPCEEMVLPAEEPSQL